MAESMVEVKFITAVSSAIGSFRRDTVHSIPLEIAKQWISAGYCTNSKELPGAPKAEAKSKGKKGKDSKE